MEMITMRLYLSFPFCSSFLFWNLFWVGWDNMGDEIEKLLDVD